MFVRLVLAIVVLGLMLWAFKRWQKLPAARRKKVAIQYLLYAAILICLIAVLTGRLHWFGAVFAGVLAAARFGFSTMIRVLPFLKMFGNSDLLGTPEFETEFLKVQIDLQSGKISGIVIAGPHAGKSILDLSSDEIDELSKHYQAHDKKSFYLIRVIQQRNGRTFDQEPSYPSVGDPSVDEALQILGLTPNPNKKDVITAHRSLMQKLHPDRGGNDYLAARVNLAKEVLIKHIDQQGR